MDIDLQDLLSALQGAGGKGLSLKQLAGQLRLAKSQRQPLRRALARLLADGRARYDGHLYREARGPRPEGDGARPQAHRTGGRRAPAAMVEGARRRREKDAAAPARKPGAEVTGVLHLKPEGYGFVSPLLGEGGRENDLFVPPQNVRGALDGDVVRVRAVRGRDGRLAAEVLETVEHRRQLALGIYQAKGKESWVIPHDRSLSGSIQVARNPRARDGEMVKVRLQREAQGALRGEVIAVLGNSGDPRFEILASAYAEGFSDEFDPATLLSAQSVPDHVHADEIAGRRDLRHLPLVTIDGEDARDFDDAVHASRTASGYRLVVAIADVAHYVRPGGPLDREALRRATSVYFPGTVLPMLPERLSNGICSLNPDVDRLCMVCDLALDASGAPLQADIYEAVMRSHARLTYTRVAEALAGQADSSLRPLLDDLRTAHELAKKLTRKREQRGSIDFDLPEAKIVLDEQGKVAEIVRRPRNDAHRLVEEFMLAANEGVARFFEVRGLPTVYRIHDQPDQEKLEAFATLARSHGFELPAGEELTPKDLNEFLEAVEGKPAQKALNSLLLRAMMQAQYSPDNIGHYGLAAPTYLHFTSPIRRYPDLMVHRLLKEHWARGGRPLREHEREEQEAYLAGVSAQCSDRERAAMKAERDVDDFYSALYMQDRVGEKYRAVVSGVAEFGLFCELEEAFVEGLLPAESLGKGVRLDKAMQRLVAGTSGASWSIGDEVLVEVMSADPARRRITLGLAQKGVMQAERWLTPEDLATAAKSKPRRPGPRAAGPAPRRPPPGSPPGRRSRRKGRRAGGR
ncbi:MAG TPA: ribonuclease R [Myxococcales bacterium]|nr:ribonuclease R [Myxococcales bacterium]